MAEAPPDHLVYLKRRPFACRCSTSIFPVEELEVLSAYGNWMEALAAGVIQPATEEQEHFLRVDREQADPSTVLERAWVRLKGRREYEQEQQTAESSAQDYGIVEWDHDRCWW